MILPSRRSMPLVPGAGAARRSITSLLLLGVILLALPALSAAQQSCLPDGDVNQDGRITAADALLAFRQASQAADPPLSACEQVIADVHPVPSAADGMLTAADALCIFRKVLGLASCLDATAGRPVAEAISFQVDPATPYVQYLLMGTDPDGDTLTYELLDDAVGTGYAKAVVGPRSGILYLTVDAGFGGEILLQYRVTDGRLFSEPAAIEILVEVITGDQGYGSLPIPPEEYAMLASADRAESSVTLPSEMDLSPFFPLPGSQGEQASCVGWATAYALKSYQERLEMGWEFTPNHLFSPAFIYNQLNGGQDRGARIDLALQLIVTQGAATLASMPYDVDDFRSQPSASARQEAAGFRAAASTRINSSRDVRAYLAARTPVVAHLEICENFDDLQGSNAVYNSFVGACEGHAVTFTGYDDNLFGGAFRVLNSWGQDWGDEGYFWLPYDFFRDAVDHAFILTDADNSATSLPVADLPPPPGVLPNLQVRDWNATFDPRPRGKGSLQYTVVNTGPGVVPSGVDVNLMLSEDQTFNSNDYYVVWETIDTELGPGDTVFRDEENPLAFSFPDGLPGGTYWMAVWVDDFNFVAEDAEDDNVSIAESRTTFENALPDLFVRNWYAEWNEGHGDGSLTYRVDNIGNSAAHHEDWDVNLVLSPDEAIGDGNEIYLFFEASDHALEPESYVYRDESNPASFNIYQDIFGDAVPDGTYYMALWVDDLGKVEESNELNNYSLGGDEIRISGPPSQLVAAAGNRQPPPAGAATDVQQEALHLPERRAPNRLYNGLELPAHRVLVREVRIGRTPQGGTSLSLPAHGGSSEAPRSAPLLATDSGEEFPAHAQQQQSADSIIFPVAEAVPMPKNSLGNQGGK